MIEQLSKTKAWAEFVEWIRVAEIHIDSQNEFTEMDIAELYTKRELLSLLVEFCCTKGYYIYVYPNWNSFNEVEGFTAVISSAYIGSKLSEESHEEATQQAVVKCFELMGEGK